MQTACPLTLSLASLLLLTSLMVTSFSPTGASGVSRFFSPSVEMPDPPPQIPHTYCNRMGQFCRHCLVSVAVTWTGEWTEQRSVAWVRDLLSSGATLEGQPKMPTPKEQSHCYQTQRRWKVQQPECCGWETAQSYALLPAQATEQSLGSSVGLKENSAGFYPSSHHIGLSTFIKTMS
jgi:hypothetical protein